MSDLNKPPNQAREFWRQHARDLYQGIRQIQASKLLPLKHLLEARNYEDVEGSLISPLNIERPEFDHEIYVEKRLNYVFLIDQLQPWRVLEIGFNWGYSASLIMESWTPCKLTSIDIAQHWYTIP